MNIKFFFKKEKQLIDKKLINSLLSRYDKIYQEKIYKTNRDNIYEFSDNTILKEPLFELALNKIHEKLALDGNCKEIKVLYGGSVNADNALDIFSTPGVDGALIGGASLKKADFIKIIEAAKI